MTDSLPTARTGCWDTVERVLLTNEQRIAYGLPPTEGKKGDPPVMGYSSRYCAWALDTVRPPVGGVAGLFRHRKSKNGQINSFRQSAHRPSAPGFANR
ncbi:hypothetical protein [Kitasatospora sp. GP82]|uniref:hypothetical protein n=1 Tax=Kitasatospora sp. GP82 TaxID=3035089 RepID=UPI0024765189|nr:hypothetical protein [Kitasatospora sp. GP82]MDH6129286.1 hypothetical protein [Kitasatospora sp. GP82]